MDQEYREVEKAKVAYEAVVTELGEAKNSLKKADYALRCFRKQEKERKQALEAAVKELRARMDALPSNIKTDFSYLEQELTRHAEQEKRILLAIEEGKKAFRLAEEVLEPLQEAREYRRREYYIDEWQAENEAKERQRLLSLQLERFCAALPNIEIRRVEIGRVSDTGDSLLKKLATKMYNQNAPIFNLIDRFDSTTARDIRIALAELEEMLECRRREQEEIARRITAMLDELP